MKFKIKTTVIYQFYQGFKSIKIWKVNLPGRPGIKHQVWIYKCKQQMIILYSRSRPVMNYLRIKSMIKSQNGSIHMESQLARSLRNCVNHRMKMLNTLEWLLNKLMLNLKIMLLGVKSLLKVMRIQVKIRRRNSWVTCYLVFQIKQGLFNHFTHAL